MRIAISTGGGDAPGLNAVIRAVVLSAHHRGLALATASSAATRACSPSTASFPWARAEVRGITHLGGTILGTTNRGNPFRYVTRDAEAASTRPTAPTTWSAAFQASGFDALVSIGGDGSLQISHELWQKGLPVVCVPKTIDNDVSGTQRTFGFDTAVSTATEAIDKLHSTAESHDRVMVVELMGRYAGWIALYSGLSGSADVILIPEIPFDIEKVCDEDPGRARRPAGTSASWWWRRARGPADGAIELVERRGVGTVDRLGGIGSKVARAIEHRTGKETRTLVLGHLQRGGSPTTYDRLLALRFGAAAVRAIADGAFGIMVGLNGPDISSGAAARVRRPVKNVPLDGDIIATARELGISLGD